MYRARLTAAALGSSRDGDSGNLSLFNILETVQCPGFPCNLPRVDFITLWTRDPSDPATVDAQFLASADGKELGKQPIAVRFGVGLKANVQIHIPQLVLTTPGDLKLQLTLSDGTVISEWIVLVHAPASPAEPEKHWRKWAPKGREYEPVQRVCRVMDEQYVDEFLRTGRLQLSSFNRFAQHPDEPRRDTQEGRHVFAVGGNQGSMMGFGKWGHDAYVLCGFRREDDWIFQLGNAGFVITDTTSFGLAVAKKLPGFRIGLEGSCVYDEMLYLIEPGAESPLTGRYDGPNPVIDPLESFQNASRQLDGAVFFQKRGAYREQLEYRWLWFIYGEAKDSIIVEVPEALQWCKRIARSEKTSN